MQDPTPALPLWTVRLEHRTTGAIGIFTWTPAQDIRAPTQTAAIEVVRQQLRDADGGLSPETRGAEALLARRPTL